MSANPNDHELLNQALKGILAGIGRGSGATRRGHAVSVQAAVKINESPIRPELMQAMNGREHGSYVIVASKVVAIAEGRIVRIPRKLVPPRRAPAQMLEALRAAANESGMPISIRDAIGADLLDHDSESDLYKFALLPSNPNLSAYKIAESIRLHCSNKCDVIITDTSAGWRKGIELIGVPTYVATPIGATAGCDLYYAQRLAALAEVMRNEIPLCPYTIVDPPTDRSRLRPNLGVFNGNGFLNGSTSQGYLDV